MNRWGKGGLCSAPAKQLLQLGPGWSRAEDAQPRDRLVSPPAWCPDTFGADCKAGKEVLVPHCLHGLGDPGASITIWRCWSRDQPRVTQGRGWGREGARRDGLKAVRTGKAGEIGGEKPLLRVSITPGAKSCCQGQAVNQVHVPFHHLRYPGRAVPFPAASAKPGMGCLSMA